MDFRTKLERVLGLIEKAAGESGRTAKDIQLVAVTKDVGSEAIREAIAAGVLLFGENRVQEAETKIPLVSAEGASWHMIGHLQTNKVKPAVSLFQTIQSVDSVRLAKAISGACAESGRTASVLLEVNVSGESQKYGFSPEEIYAAVEAIVALPNVFVKGLMGMAPNTGDAELKRAAFKKLRNIFSVLKTLKNPQLEMKVLSMGMSDDFEIAIREGSNMVRLGRALFG
ncbi:MAG: YggS family pyridoxal phosphate-dependent enzyme [Candidatus Omnitrophica bacterium]|nr:YggS family pyridoxal phosphate-dependent enzyme [Candidatus Omnitrophota bacterium]